MAHNFVSVRERESRRCTYCGLELHSGVKVADEACRYSGYAATAEVKTPLQRFLDYLPDDRKPDSETVGIIERYYNAWMRGICTQNGAINLLETAARHPHQSTIYRIQAAYGLILGDVLAQSDSGSAYLIKAFEVATLASKVVKFGKNVEIEHQIFMQLGFSDQNEALASNIVPVHLIHDQSGTQGILMPAFCCSLSSLANNDIRLCAVGENKAFHDGVLNRVIQIDNALNRIHSRNVYHNDIKPGNILIDSSGDWYLCDFGSSTHPDVHRSSPVRYTGYYHPTDFNRQRVVKQNSKAYDKLLLAVTVLDLLGLLKLSGGFTISQMKEALKGVENDALGSLLLSIIEI